MRMMPRNRYSLLALLWLAAGLYSLLFREAAGGAPPFAHFDKVAHFALFFGQFWLTAKAFMQAQRPILYAALFTLAVLLAAAVTVTVRPAMSSCLDNVPDFQRLRLPIRQFHEHLPCAWNIST